MKKLLITLLFCALPVFCFGYETTNLDFLNNGRVDTSGGKIYLVDSITGSVDTDYEIINVDYDTSLHYFPMKSEASFVFFGDTIHVRITFQNGNYADTIFYEILDPVLNSDMTEQSPKRIKRIAHYSTPTVDASDAFNTPPKGTTNIRDVGVGKTYTTIQAGINAATAGDTVYIHDGVYLEEFSGALKYLWIQKDIVLQGVGNVRVISEAINITIYQVDGDVVCNNIIVDGQTTDDEVWKIHPSNTTTTDFNNMVITGADENLIQGTSAGDLTIKNTSIIGDSTKPVQAMNFYGDTMSGCFFKDFIIAGRTDIVFNYNEFPDNFFANSLLLFSVSASVFDCNFGYEFNAIASNNVDSPLQDLTIKESDFNQGDSTGSNVSAVFQGNLNNYKVIIDKCNFVSELVTYTALTQRFIYLTDVFEPEITNCTFNSETKSALIHIDIVFDGDNTGVNKINYNKFYSNSTSSLTVSLGGEAAFTNQCDGSEFMGNLMRGYKYDHPSEVSTTIHSAILNCGINFKIAYNNISYTTLGIVVKSGTEQSYTTNGIYGNLFYENSKSIWVRGVDSIRIFNNTIYHSDSSYGTPVNYGIEIDENTPKPGNYSKYPFIENNLIQIDNASGTSAIFLDDSAAIRINSSNNNHLYGAQFLLTANSVNYSTLASAQGAGFLSDSYDSDPLLFDKSLFKLWPTSGSESIGNGKLKGAPYNVGLDISSVWTNSLVFREGLTKLDIGAYQIEKTSVVTQNKLIIISGNKSIIFRK